MSNLRRSISSSKASKYGHGDISIGEMSLREIMNSDTSSDASSAFVRIAMGRREIRSMGSIVEDGGGGVACIMAAAAVLGRSRWSDVDGKADSRRGSGDTRHAGGAFQKEDLSNGFIGGQGTLVVTRWTG